MDESELKSVLSGRLREWRRSGNALVRVFEFPDFGQALTFVNRVGERAEHMQHHPDVDIRYNKVTITLTTHDQGGITSRDVELAAYIQEMAPHYQKPRTAA